MQIVAPLPSAAELIPPCTRLAQASCRRPKPHKRSAPGRPHVGNLSKEDAEDLLDFTTTLLERLITEPKRLEQAEAHRKKRRKPATPEPKKRRARPSGVPP